MGKKPYINSLIQCLIFFLFVSCTSPSRLEQALRLAGNNRNELEKVLTFYSHSPSDSLKLKAAIFLIENMPGHYSYADSEMEYLNRYYKEIDSIAEYYRDMGDDDRYYLFKEVTDKYQKQPNLSMDIHCIKSDYLINNIEDSFDLWEEGKWARQISFDEFCEYLLPYKASEYQILDNWREYLKEISVFSLNELQYNELSKNSTYDACRTVNEELKNIVRPRILRDSYNAVKKISTLANIAYGTCDDYALLATSVMRAKGIPCIIDFTPQWPFRRQGHTWNVLLDNWGKNIVFEGCESAPGMPHKNDHKMAKVFRRTYAINEELKKIYSSQKYIPSTFNNYFLKDVTEEYISTVDISLSIPERTNYKYAYLAVFDDKQWIPIHWGEIKGNRVVFKKMGKNVVYLPVYYDKEGVVPFADPILVTIDGQTKFIKCDHDSTNVLTLRRKYPVLYDLFITSRTIGGKFQAADNIQFDNPVTFHTILEHGIYTGEVYLDSFPNTYQYWRYYSPERASCNMGEIQFFQSGSSIPIYGNIIGTDGSYSGKDIDAKERVFDRDVLTIFDAPYESDCWVGMDFGKPVSINRIVYYPRSDGNYIEIGDYYELVYWTSNGWKSLGHKYAEGSTISFEGCPQNALFLLHNHTKGKEERIFTYEDGKQVWW